MRVMSSLFELVNSGENAFHITVTDFYTMDFTFGERTGQFAILHYEYYV